MTAFAVAVATTATAGAGSVEARGLERIPGEAGVVTDGSGLAVWQSGSRLHLLRDGRRRPEVRAIDGLANCTLAAAGAGKAVFDCPGEHAFNPLLYDLATGVVERPAGADRVGEFADANQANGEHYSSQAIGRSLLRFGATHVRSSTGLLNWHTGELLERPAQTARTVLTLDLPTGLAPLCRPLRVTSYVESNEFGAEYAAFDPATLRRGRLLIDHLGTVVVRRCGSGRTRVLHRYDARNVLLTARYAAWISPGRAHAYVFRSRRHLSWRLPSRRRSFQSLFATDRRLFARVGSRSYFVDL